MTAFSLVPALVIAAAAAGLAQVRINPPQPPPVPGQVRPHGERDYGPPRVTELDNIEGSSDSYHRAHVITTGVLGTLVPDQYWTLRDGTVTVLLLPGYEIGASDLNALVGSTLEVRGIVRRLKRKDYTPKGIDTDVVDDPTLPPLPELNTAWPRHSITVLAFVDRSKPGDKPTEPTEGAVVRDILENPAEYAEKKVSLRGQFRGANLFGDLPGASRRSSSDWVLKDGDMALWVTGKAPRGKGWSLDPGYQGDAVRWVEVEGKAEVANGVVYVRASKIRLATPPPAEAADAGRR